LKHQRKENTTNRFSSKSHFSASVLSLIASNSFMDVLRQLLNHCDTVPAKYNNVSNYFLR
jgi:hypothetical protein